MIATSLVAATSTSIGFKDWALVCAALGQGDQSLILRKGGIAEGREGFRFKHESFFLFPTQYHQQAARIRPDAAAKLGTLVPPVDGTMEIQYAFTVEQAWWIDDWAAVSRLGPFHVWREEVIRERFEYGDQPGLQCAFGRVYRLESRWSFPDRPAYGGCRSWVTLPTFPAEALATTPVLDDARHEIIAREIRAAIQIC